MQVAVETQPKEDDAPLNLLQSVPTGIPQPAPFVAKCREEVERMLPAWEGLPRSRRNLEKVFKLYIAVLPFLLLNLGGLMKSIRRVMMSMNTCEATLCTFRFGTFSSATASRELMRLSKALVAAIQSLTSECER